MILSFCKEIKNPLPTFIEKPEGAGFLGQSNSVLCILIPDSMTMTALSSGLKKKNQKYHFVWPGKKKTKNMILIGQSDVQNLKNKLESCPGATVLIHIEIYP